MTVVTAVYVLCLATSVLCAWLLSRAWARSRTPLLFWSAVSFFFLAINNALLVADMIFFLTVDLRIWRTLSALAAGAIMIYGCIWSTDR